MSDRCRNCGAPIRLFNYSMGQKWEHVDPNASFPTHAKGSTWTHCKQKVAEPMEDEYGHEPCCTACNGAGGSHSGPCWDCKGTGHPHAPQSPEERERERIIALLRGRTSTAHGETFVMWNEPYRQSLPLLEWLAQGAPEHNDSEEAGLAAVRVREVLMKSPPERHRWVL